MVHVSSAACFPLSRPSSFQLACRVTGLLSRLKNAKYSAYPRAPGVLIVARQTRAFSNPFGRLAASRGRLKDEAWLMKSSDWLVMSDLVKLSSLVRLAPTISGDRDTAHSVNSVRSSSGVKRDWRASPNPGCGPSQPNGSISSSGQL